MRAVSGPLTVWVVSDPFVVQTVINYPLIVWTVCVPQKCGQHDCVHCQWPHDYVDCQWPLGRVGCQCPLTVLAVNAP